MNNHLTTAPSPGLTASGAGIQLADPRLRCRTDACLALRVPRVSCRRCAQSCPAQALRIGDEGPELAASCLGCGHCAAACPTGALSVEGFEVRQPLRAGNGPLQVECWKTPSADAVASAIRVPCLGGVGLEQLLEWVLGSSGRIELVDRGWCGHCSARGATQPAAALVKTAARVLTECGWPKAAHPRIVRRPTPLTPIPPAIPQPATEVRLARRDFLRRFVTESAPTTAPLPAEPQGPSARRAARALPKRERILALAAAAARAHGRPAPPSLFPALRASDRCRHHGACALACPTGALAGYDTAIEAGVTFRAAACVACGACVTACPERALILVPRSRPATRPDAPQPLTRFAYRSCRGCLKSFVAGGDDACCPDCGRNHRLARDLFGAQARRQGAVEQTFP